MTRRRFYAPPGAFTTDSRSLTLQAEELRHVRDVLRLKPGDEVYVFDGEGKEFRCAIAESGREVARLIVLAEVAPARPESPLQLTLAVALLKGDKFDLVVQKATELGVARFIPVQTKLADIRLRDQTDAKKRVARWQRIALEAAKQSGRARVPEVVAPICFASLVETRVARGQNRLMFSERQGQSLAVFKDNLVGLPQSITALVGSEGGWADKEIEQASNTGWAIVTLGGRTLRAETGAIAGTVLLQHLFGDLV